MNFLEKLLDGVAVEWKPLGEVAKIQRGRRLVKSELEEFGNYAVFQNCMTPLGYYHESNVKSDTTFIISAGAAGEIGYSGVDFWAADDVYYFLTPENLKSKFLYYFLLTQQTKILGQVRRASVPRLSKTAFEKIQIPIPPLKIQAEIVRILDTFIALTAELTAELTDRQKQYNYYRDRLLTFEKGEVEWKPLGDLCVIGDGLHGTPKYDDSGEYYFINGNNLDNGRIVYNDKTKKVDELIFNKHGIVFTVENTVFMSINGTIGSVSFFNNEKIVLGKSVAFFNIKSPELYSRFLFYFLLTEYSKNYFEAQKTGSTIKNLGLKALRTFKIPVPPLAEQARIVAILDKFDTLTTSIREGLPREIALRQKQYEYYRDLLLTFPKSEEIEAHLNSMEKSHG